MARSTTNSPRCFAGSVAAEQRGELLFSAQTQASVAAIQDVIQLLGHDPAALHADPDR